MAMKVGQGGELIFLLSRNARNVPTRTYIKGMTGSKGKGKEIKEVVKSVANPYESMSETVCAGGNILKDGEDPVLKVDSDYPVWVWGLLDSPAYDDDPSSKGYLRHKNKTNAHARNMEMKLKAN